MRYYHHPLRVILPTCWSVVALTWWWVGRYTQVYAGRVCAHARKKVKNWEIDRKKIGSVTRKKIAAGSTTPKKNQLVR